ncbi:MAG: rhodanese-like domain-containing protein [Magnetovibrionaceae bacterium]
MDNLEGVFSNNLVLALVLVAAAIMLNRSMPRWTAGCPFISPKDAEKKIDKTPGIVVLDVRTEAEYSGKKGHIPGAVNLPMAEVALRLESIEKKLSNLKDQPILIHCAAEGRAAKVAKRLRKAGFSDLSVIQGGFSAWRRADLPVEVEEKEG